MRLNETNRRRALQRRRKLMPEPRRITSRNDGSNESSRPEENLVLRETPSDLIMANHAESNISQVDEHQQQDTGLFHS